MKRRRIINKCIYCQKETNNPKFCSPFCSAKYQKEVEHKKYIELWKKGEKSGSRGKGEYQISEHVRRYLLEKNNYKCSLCGWGERNPFSGKVPLEIDHIDGNWKNNTPENLRLICPNCHSLTETYRGANSGKGRGSEMRGSRLYRRLAEEV